MSHRNFITPVADALVAAINTIDVSPAIKAKRWGQIYVKSFPAAIVTIPSGELTSLDSADLQLGSWDVNSDWTVQLLAEVRGDAQRAQDYLVDAICELAYTLRADPSLGGLVDDVRLVGWTEPESIEQDTNRVFLSVQATVEIRHLLPTL